MNNLPLRRRRYALGMIAGGALSLLAALGASTALVAAADAPAAVAAKLAPGSDLSGLWSDPTVRKPIIVEFAMPELADAASFASPAEADAAQTSKIHGIQDRILGAAFGSDLAAAQSADKVLKRMDFSPMFGINATAEEVAKFASNPDVVRIHEDGIDDVYLDQSLPLIGMPNAYAAGATGNGVYVAVLDTGGRRAHEFLGSKIQSAACFSTTNSQSTSYCPGGASQSTDINSANDCDPNAVDGCGHGTHVAGTAAGFNSNRQNGEPAHGVARSSGLISINVFSTFSSGCPQGGQCVRTWNTDQILGLERVFALRNQFNIASANMSLGGSQFFSHCDSDSRKNIIDQLRAARIATVIAAGNSGFNDSVGSPGCISSAITVASSTKQDARSSFSNWGTLIDVVAPGSSIFASYVSGGNNQHYASLSGTSMASPHVAGVFGAIRTAFPNATVDQIEQALESTGLGISSAGVTKPRIRVDAALAALGGNPPPPPPGPPNNNFANRIAINNSPTTVTGNNAGANKEAGEPNHAGLTGATSSVWWRYTPSQSGQITITTAGSNFDTVLAVYTGSSVGGLTGVASNDDSSGLTSAVSFPGTAGVQYQIAVAGFNGASGNINVNLSGGGGGGGNSSIVSAVTPVARATGIGSTVTAFATIINSGNTTATSCSVAQPGGIPATFQYRSRNHQTGALGAINTPVNIPAGGRQDYLMSFTPNGSMSQSIGLVFDCSNTSPAPSVSGLNTFLLTATGGTPPADLISIAVTPTNDGIMNVPLGGSGFAALAAVNLGNTATIVASLDANPIGGSGRSLAGTPTLCRTDPNTGACFAPPAPSVNVTVNAGQTVTFTAFFQSNGTPIAFDPAGKRLFVHFRQNGAAVGSASVAVRTTGGGGASLAAAE